MQKNHHFLLLKKLKNTGRAQLCMPDSEGESVQPINTPTHLIKEGASWRRDEAADLPSSGSDSDLASPETEVTLKADLGVKSVGGG